MRALLAALLLLLYAAPLYAQAGAPTSWNLRIYTAGAALVDAKIVTTAQMSCGQAKRTGPNVNPTEWRVDDPADASKDCVHVDVARLTALADGAYEGTAQAINADGSSSESARVPFTRRRPNPPGVPTGLRLIQ